VKLPHWLKYLNLAYFSKPVGDRILYRGIRKSEPCRIVHIGLGSVARTQRLLDLAVPCAPGAVQFTGIDMFEAADKTSLKDFHRAMSRDGVRLKLVPGDAYSGLARIANVLSDTNLLLIGSDVDDTKLDAAWFYVPRMLADGAIVLREREGTESGPVWEAVRIEDIFTWADAQHSARRAA
jgi:hypothetical protein